MPTSPPECSALLCASRQRRRSTLAETVNAFLTLPPSSTISRASLAHRAECATCTTPIPATPLDRLNLAACRLLSYRSRGSDD